MMVAFLGVMNVGVVMLTGSVEIYYVRGHVKKLKTVEAEGIDGEVN